MVAIASESVAAALLGGELPEAPVWAVSEAAAVIADAIGRGDADVTIAKVRAAAKVLQDHRLFEQVRLIAEAWRDCRGFDTTLARHHAQSLIELSAFDTAERVLTGALGETAAAAVERSAQVARERLEYEGLLGRLEKQRFVVTGDLDALRRATDSYLAQYRQPGQTYWHGINAVALLAREQREHVDRPATADLSAMAKAILKDVTRRYRTTPHDTWLPATASEANLALGACDKAELWLYRLLNHPGVRPFHVHSYDRQLREIWGATVGGDRCQDRLTSIIARHVLRTERRVTLSSSELRQAAGGAGTRASARVAETLERNFSGEIGFSVETLQRMLQACASIGCVTNAAGERLGTGFLVDGAGLKASFAPGPVFVTNAHVLSSTVANAISPAEARVTFEVESAAAGTPRFYTIDGGILFTSPPGEVGVYNGDTLDVTIVRLASLPEQACGLPVAAALPLVDAKTKAYVVGHPRGGGLQIALHDSVLLDIDDHECLVHYRTPTDPGSSGSPVFNREWDVMALHHAGSSRTPRLHGEGFYEANEGISLLSIRRTLNE